MKKSEKNEKFSVLMSIYYKENPDFFDLSLKSIMIEQTVLPDEVVLIKDGPLSKELDDVVNKYQEKFPTILKVYSLEKNMGLGYALQFGVDKCQYDLIARMDSDDISKSIRFEKQLKFMSEHKDISVLGGYIEEFEETLDEEFRLKKMPCTDEEILNYAKFRNPMNHVTVFFRKKDILEVGSYQPLDYLEDHYLWSRLLVAGKKFANLPETLVYVRVGNGFNQRRGSKKYILGWKKLQNYLYKNNITNYFQKIRNIFGMYVMVYSPTCLRVFLYNNVLRTKKK